MSTQISKYFTLSIPRNLMIVGLATEAWVFVHSLVRGKEERPSLERKGP